MPQHFFISLLLLLIGSFFLNELEEIAPNRSDNLLDLSDAETVRVLILERENPDVIRINATESPLTFQTDSKDIILNPGDGFVFLYFDSDKIRFKLRDLSIQTEELTVENPDGLIQLFSQKTSNRYYRGNLEIRNSSQPGFQIVNAVALEDYVTSVVGSEMNFREMDALKSQAVVSRTYTLWSIHKSAWHNFHLKDHELNQVYKGEFISRPDYAEAARATAGEILTWSNKLILAAYSSTCGGITGNNHEVWDGEELPYLNSVNDQKMCEISPHFKWKSVISKNELLDFIRSRYGFSANKFDSNTHPSGRINSITFYDRFNKELTFSGNEFRLIVNRHFEDMSLKSTLFTVHEADNNIHFYGNGLGHGVGMCQWGARGFANSGWNYSDILSFYFNGSKIVDLKDIKDQKIALSN